MITYYKRWKKMSRWDQFFVMIIIMAINIGIMLASIGLLAISQWIGLDSVLGLLINHIAAGICVVAGTIVMISYPMFVLTQYRRR